MATPQTPVLLAMPDEQPVRSMQLSWLDDLTILTQYAANENFAEKGPGSAAEAERNPAADERYASPETTGNSAQNTDTTDHIRDTAKIWSLYLHEAESAAKERAELWKTGLDSLLLFVR